DDFGLFSSAGKQKTATRFEDGRYSHRDREARHLIERSEEAGVVADGLFGQRLQSSAAAQRRAWLIEADVPVAPDAQNLQVDAAGIADHLLVPLAIGFGILRQPVGHVGLLGPLLEPFEEIFFHEVPVALIML